jgi:hypothetical protein
MRNLKKNGGNSGSNCHGRSSSTRIDLEDTNTTRRKPDKNKKTRIVLPGDLEYKAPKTGVEPEWFNTETSSVFILLQASCMLATWLACMNATWLACMKAT